ncbi:MAG TPA: glycosyltransferase family 2 protein [Candidatus Saccharimonadales bacterium]|jgi:glycosyltransferase involved in cell wall biosynthesis|nr:glycosyltransferase family 2 protein [Candidatus Saccharimonadales bacterium]
MRVSIVIPAYNEQCHLALCLEAIKNQNVKPYQVIVVDNNSSDNTAKIAKSYSFVKLLHENNHGIVFARNTGFDAASGSIIARIDADTIIPTNWIENIQNIFTNENIDAVSGSVSYYDAPFNYLNAFTDLFFRAKIAGKLNKTVGYLYGCNMALTRRSWKSVRHKTCSSNDVHEDLDLAIHLKQSGFNIVFDKDLKAAISIRSFNIKLTSFHRYVQMVPDTYKIHHILQKRYFYPLVVLVMTAYFPIRLGLRFYNPRTNKLLMVENWQSAHKSVNFQGYVANGKIGTIDEPRV